MPAFPCKREMASFPSGAAIPPRRNEEKRRPAPRAGSRIARAQAVRADQPRDGDPPIDRQAGGHGPPRGVHEDLLRAEVQPVRPPRRVRRRRDVRAAARTAASGAARAWARASRRSAARASTRRPTSATAARTSRAAACASSTPLQRFVKKRHSERVVSVSGRA